MEPLYVTSGVRGDMVPLNVVALKRDKGKYEEGDVIQPIASEYGKIEMTGISVWFAMDTDGTLLVATDGAPLYFFVLGLH